MQSSFYYLLINLLTIAEVPGADYDDLTMKLHQRHC